MTEGLTMFDVGSRVEFEDGSNKRIGFVLSQEPASGTYPDGCSVLFKIRETGQIRLSRIALSDLKESKANAYAFKVHDPVTVVAPQGGAPITGKVFERAAMDQDTFEPSYAVVFKDESGRTALSWWPESALATAE